MSTPVGHSRLQPLQRNAQVQRLAHRLGGEVASWPSWPVSARRSVLARPRVRCCSSLRDAVGRAHDAGLELAAVRRCCCTSPRRPAKPPPVAPDGRPVEARSSSRRQPAVVRACSGTALRSSMRGGSHDLAGVHAGPSGRSTSLISAKARVEPRAEHRLDPFASAPARRRARRNSEPLYLAHQSAGLLGDGAHLAPRRRRFMLRIGPHVQACRPRHARTRCRSVPCLRNTCGQPRRCIRRGARAAPRSPR